MWYESFCVVYLVVFRMEKHDFKIVICALLLNLFASIEEIFNLNLLKVLTNILFLDSPYYANRNFSGKTAFEIDISASDTFANLMFLP